MSELQDWLDLARKAERLALISHVSPDGDTVGAALALRLAFLSMGKSVDVICDGTIPPSIAFLNGTQAYITPDQAQPVYDAAIAVDVSDRRLLGASSAVFDAAKARLVIDHHETNEGYGDCNYIRRGECACCLLAYEAICAMGVPLSREMANCLLLGMSTDTGHFQYPYTSKAAMIAAGEMIEAGADVSYLTRMLYRTVSRQKLELTRVAYRNMRFELDGQVGVITISQKEFEETGCTPAHTDGLVNKALEVEGVRMAILATERDEGVKISLRAVEPETVNDIAKVFGGGGHAQAAGCTLYMPMHKAVDAVLAAIREKMES
ncbi:MAG: DHH family phosphoesterase [Clostridia bacterium]|nr:DHH family phosphoesterase [Clostridia bacterium]